MEGRRALFVAFLLAAVCTASSGECRCCRTPLIASPQGQFRCRSPHLPPIAVEVQELGVQELGEAQVVPPPTSVTVMVSPNEPKP